MSMLEQLAQPQQNTYSFDAEKELAELKAATLESKKYQGKKEKDKPLWLRNAEKDFLKLSEEIPFIRAEKTYNHWVDQAKNTHQVSSIISKEVKTLHQTRPTELVPISVGTTNSSSAEYAQYTPYIAGEPEILDRKVDETLFKGSLAEQAKGYLAYLNAIEGVDDRSEEHRQQLLLGASEVMVAANLGELDGENIGLFEAMDRYLASRKNGIEREKEKFEKLAQEYQEAKVLAGRVHAFIIPPFHPLHLPHPHLSRRLIAAGVGIGILGGAFLFRDNIGSLFSGAQQEASTQPVAPSPTATPTRTSEPAAEDQIFTKIRFPDPDPNMKAELEAQNKPHFDGYLAGLRGQMVKAFVEEYRAKAAEEGIEYSDDDWVAYQQILEADPTVVDTLEESMVMFRDDNLQIAFFPQIEGNTNRELLITRRNPNGPRSEGQPIEFKWRKNMADYFGALSIQAPVVEPAASPTPEPTPSPTGVPQLGANFNAEHPSFFVCPSIDSESKFLTQAQGGCLNESLRKVSINPSTLTEANLLRGNTTDQDLVRAAAKFGIPVEVLRAALPLDRQGAMYVAFVNEKGQKTIGSIFFNFTNSPRLDLMSPNKTLPRTAKLTYVYQDGKIALVLDMCGNLIPGQEIPKAAPSPTPSPIPAVPSPTPSEVPTPGPTLTRTPTPRLTPPISYPSPEATATSTPVPTSTTTIFIPPRIPADRGVALKMIDNPPFNNCTGPEDTRGPGFNIQFNFPGFTETRITGADGIAVSSSLWQLGTSYTGFERTDLNPSGFILESQDTQGFVGTGDILRICNRFAIPVIPPTSTETPTPLLVSPTPAPTNTETLPTATQSVPTATGTPEKPATPSPAPTNTDVPFPTATREIATATPKPATSTPRPTTATPRPTREAHTPTAAPTNTDVPFPTATRGSR